VCMCVSGGYVGGFSSSAYWDVFGAHVQVIRVVCMPNNRIRYKYHDDAPIPDSAALESTAAASESASTSSSNVAVTLVTIMESHPRDNVDANAADSTATTTVEEVALADAAPNRRNNRCVLT
jgi:hypothetical protein